MQSATASERTGYYTVAQAARALGVSPSTVWRWIDADKLPAYRVGPRAIRIRESDLQAAIRPARRGKRQLAAMPRLVVPPPSPGELARRQSLIAAILHERTARRIAPLTSADLVRQAREEVGPADGHGR